MKVEVLNSDRENDLLKTINLKIDSWGRVVNISNEEGHFVQAQAPLSAIQMYCFSFHVLEWIRGHNEWYIWRFDDSSSLSNDEKIIFSSLSNFPAGQYLNILNHSLLIVNGFIEGTEEIRLASLIFHCLMFEAHGWLTASGIKNGRRLGIQDGYIYLFSNNKVELEEAKTILDGFEENQLGLPDWVLNQRSHSH